MKKITEIKITKLTTHATKNALGQRVHEKIPVELKRKVKTIQGWARFGHYMIDWAILMGLIFGITFLIETNTSTNIKIGNYQYEVNYLGYILIVFYYTILEATMGRTIGKFATQSYVIDEYANKPEFGTILLRSLCRIIPFFAFSCLGERGWHDRWTKTYVVSKTEWDILKKGINDDFLSDDSEILDI